MLQKQADKGAEKSSPAEEVNQLKQSQSPEDTKQNKKLVLLKDSIFSGSEPMGKNDKKNIVKNVINAYQKYLKAYKDEGKEVDYQLNTLKNLINAKKYNNQLVTAIISDEALRCYFKHFLTVEAGDWL